jgi:hypothetical protein
MADAPRRDVCPGKSERFFVEQRMPEPESVKLPEIPSELWMLWKIGTTD